MDKEKFVANFAAQFDETELLIFTSKTEYKGLDEWSSQLALSIIAMVDEEYHVRLKGDDIRNSLTIGDLYEIVNTRL